MDKHVRYIKESFQKIHEAILASQQRKKHAANKHQRPMEFKEDDWAPFKFSKARLRNTTGKDNNGVPMGHQKYYAKLAKRYYGPFQILERINKTAYRLKLLESW